LEKICDYITYISDGKLVFCDEKDRLLEKYAVLKCPAEELKNYEGSAVISVNETKYGAEALVVRNKMPHNTPVETADIEKIILFMSKR
jgi:ABC-2 type transport system ATP-binding protein